MDSHPDQTKTEPKTLIFLKGLHEPKKKMSAKLD